MVIYERIKQLCKQNHITLSDLAEATDVSINTIKNWGRGSKATANDLLAIARYFHVSMDYLTGNSDSPYPHTDLATAIHVLQDVQECIEQKRRTLEAQLKAQENGPD